MKIASFSVRRPVTVSMFYLAIILFGIISYLRLPQELFPPLSYPEISIFTHYENASPEEVESLITRPLEETISTVARLKRIKSFSREGVSLIRASFNWGTDMDMASLYIREKIDLIKERLPDQAREPVVMKMNPFELPVVVMNLYLERGGEEREMELTSFWKNRLKDELEKIDGVASAQVSGGITPEIRVSVEPGKLWSKGLTLREVVETLEKTNYSYPAGFIEDEYFEYLVRTVGEYKEIDDIKKTLLKRERNWEADDASAAKRIVRLADVADVKEVSRKRTSFSRYIGKPSLTISLKRQSGANTIKISKALREKLDNIKKTLPDYMKVSIIYDQSRFIQEALDGVRNAAVMGGILSFIILYIFMKDFGSSLLVASSIIFSTAGGILLVYFSGISLNIISLGGIALGIGMMVDNAIVVVENLAHSSECSVQGEGAGSDIARRVSEVGPAIFASTFTTIATFLPMVFTAGLAGQMIKELALSITYCLLFSLLVAFTFIPCFSRKINYLRLEDKASRMASIYEKILRNFLKKKGRYLFFVGIIFILSIGLLLNLRREFTPDTYETAFYLDIEFSEGTALKKTDGFVRNVEKFLMSRPEIKETVASVGELEEGETKTGTFMGPHQARLMINLKSEYRKKRNEIIFCIKRFLEKEGKELKSYNVIMPAGIAGVEGGEKRLDFEIVGSNFDEIISTARRFKQSVREVEGVVDAADNIPVPVPEKKIMLERDRIALAGLSVKEVAEAIQAARVGKVATYFKRESGDIPVRVEFRKDTAENFLRDVFFITPDRIRIPLGEVARVSSGHGPSEIHHIDRERAVNVRAVFSPGKEVKEKEFAKILKDFAGGNVSIEFAGERAMIKESFRDLCLALLLAVFLIYMIMAAQFESLWQPFIIMLSFPTALIGVAFFLYVRGMSLNIVSLLGIILLGGIAVNNGIVLVSCIDLYRKDMPMEEAVVVGCVRRLRPVLMTTLTTIVALIPLSLGIGRGAELEMSMATAVMGGLISSTILTLFVIPAVYIIGAKLMKK